MAAADKSGADLSGPVIHVVRQFRPSVGGLEDAVLNLAREQREAGVDARVVTLDRIFTNPDVVLPAEQVVEGIPVRRLPWRGSSRYPLAPSVLDAISGASLVHVHGIDFFFDFLALTKALHGRRLVATTHGGFFHTQFQSRLKRLWFGSITRMSARAYDGIAACSAGDAEMFASIGNGRVSLIENGVNAGKFAGKDGVQRDPSRLLYFGRFCAHKRIGAAFAILAALRAQGGNWSLVVAGTPSDLSAADLQTAAAQAGVADHVRFRISPDDAAIADEAARASFYICPSAHEGFGIAAVEAAGAGLVPVLSSIAPFAKLVDRLGAGMLIDPAAPDDAAAQIRALAADDLAPIRERLARAARAYGWREAAAKYADLYAMPRGVAMEAA